ncbi:class I SAM-dependent methyltransferase [Nocardiopsis flavescens]|uniref:class I SAM-dependent methyltransferase n=1 Tax=Nocardiopsis flavescens TaxID=758803 RepID=UPI003651F5B9
MSFTPESRTTGDASGEHTPGPVPGPEAPAGASPAAAEPTNRWVYNPLTMGPVYDAFVIGWSHEHFWGISNKVIHELYDTHLGRVHADVGVGTGHFLRGALRRRREDLAGRRLHLLDNSPSSLNATSRRVLRNTRGTGLEVDARRCDALAAWPLPDASVDSVGTTMMLHCLPDEDGRGFPAKAAVLTEAARVLRPGGSFFGCTVLGERDPAPISRSGERMRRVYNTRENIFHNTGDTAAQFESLLGEAFGDSAQTRVRTVGATLVWEVVR